MNEDRTLSKFQVEWTEDRVKNVLAHLQQHTHVEASVKSYVDMTGDRVSSSAIRSAFRNFGLKSPSAYLKGSKEPIMITSLQTPEKNQPKDPDAHYDQESRQKARSNAQDLQEETILPPARSLVQGLCYHWAKTSFEALAGHFNETYVARDLLPDDLKDHYKVTGVIAVHVTASLASGEAPLVQIGHSSYVRPDVGLTLHVKGTLWDVVLGPNGGYVRGLSPHAPKSGPKRTLHWLMIGLVCQEI
jgi:hypothetical protein